MKTKPESKTRKPKMGRAEQRRAWIAKGLCGFDGKDPIWKGHSTAECRKHFLYFKAKATEYAKAAKRKPRASDEGKVPQDLVDVIARNIAGDIGHGATVQLAPTTREALFNSIRQGITRGVRQIGFQPSR